MQNAFTERHSMMKSQKSFCEKRKGSPFYNRIENRQRKRNDDPDTHP